jgi:hypothetical protein
VSTPATDELIPRPPVIRERLSRALKEAALLRRLLKVSEAAAEERHRLKMLAGDTAPSTAVR